MSKLIINLVDLLSDPSKTVAEKRSGQRVIFYHLPAAHPISEGIRT